MSLADDINTVNILMVTYNYMVAGFLVLPFVLGLFIVALVECFSCQSCCRRMKENAEDNMDGLVAEGRAFFCGGHYKNFN